MQQCPPREMPEKLEKVSDKEQENLINTGDLNEKDNYI